MMPKERETFKKRKSVIHIKIREEFHEKNDCLFADVCGGMFTCIL